MGPKASRFLPSIMDYSSFNQHIEGRNRDLYQNGKPRPPRKRKKDIYDPTKYEKLNQRIENTPDNLLNTDTRELVNYLTKACMDDDLAKVHALFYWVASRSLFATFQPDAKKYSPIWYMNRIFTGHTNFAHFFYVLCWHADIPCVIIGGITKNSAYKIGFPVVVADMAAQWNAVYVEDDWHLANIQWACIYANEPTDWERVVIVTKKEFSSERNHHDNRGNISSTPKKPKTKNEYFHRVNDYYFLTDPDELIWTHFPNKTHWQLLSNTITLDEFLNHFYVREQFYLLDMSLTQKSHTDCVLLVDENREVRIEFGLPPNCDSTYRFKYTLSHHWSSSWHPVKHQSLLQQGRYEVKDDQFLLTLHLTSEGTYKLDIFGSEQKNRDFYLICSYVLKCSHTEEGPALPLKFFLGYGAGVKPQLKTIKTKDGRIKLPFPIERNYNIMHELRNLKDSLLHGCSLMRMIDDVDGDDNECCPLVTWIIELRLPEPGEYSLKVYGKKTDEPCRNLCNYRIIYKADNETSPMLEGSTTKDSLVFQQNRIAVLSHPGSFIQTNLSTMNIMFRSEYQLKCKLFANDTRTQATTKTSVLHNMDTKVCQINVTIPICGDYTLKVYAIFGEEVSVEGVGQVYELHSYRIRRVNSDHFPIRGFRPVATYIAGTFETDQSIINISQTEITNETLLVLQYQKSSLCSYLVKVFEQDDGWNIEVTLPQIGDYLLSLLKKDTATGLIGNVTRYLLRRKQGVEIKDRANDDETSGTAMTEDGNTEENESVLKTELKPVQRNAKTKDGNTEEKESVPKTEFIQRNTKPILKDDIMVKEEETLETEFKLPIIENNNLSLASCVNDDIQKKTIQFLENKNVTTNQAKGYSASVVDIQAVVEVDVKKPFKSDQPSKISGPENNKSGPEKNESANKDETPQISKELSNLIAEKLAPISEIQTAEPKRTGFSKDPLLWELENAIIKRDIERLKLAIDRSEKHLTSDILDKAKKLLDVLQTKKGLVEAHANRDKELLGSALEEARRVNSDNELDQEIALAEKMYERLCRLDGLRYTIGSFNSRAVSEIKSYSNPPKAVIVVMRAVFLILNQPEDELQDWNQIRSLLRSTRKPFLRRILHCNPKWLSWNSVTLAEESLGQLNAGDISCVSEVAKVLFAWVKTMIEEQKNQELDIDFGNLEK